MGSRACGQHRGGIVYDEAALKAGLERGLLEHLHVRRLLGVDLQRRARVRRQHGVQPAEELRAALVRVVLGPCRGAEPLHGGDADGAVKGAFAVAQPNPNVRAHDVAAPRRRAGRAQHVLADVGPNPGVARLFKRSAAVARAAAHVEDQRGHALLELDQVERALGQVALCGRHAGVLLVLGRLRFAVEALRGTAALRTLPGAAVLVF